MKSNFKIVSFRDLEIEGRPIDLHNNFKLVGYEFNALDESLLLKFGKGSGSWIPEDELEIVTFSHSKISFLYISWTPEIEFPEDARTLSEITFYPSGERDENNNFLDRETPEHNDDIIYSFISGKVIRVGCEEVCAEI